MVSSPNRIRKSMTDEIRNLITALCDLALKTGGVGNLDNVNKVITYLKSQSNGTTEEDATGGGTAGEQPVTK